MALLHGDSMLTMSTSDRRGLDLGGTVPFQVSILNSVAQRMLGLRHPHLSISRNRVCWAFRSRTVKRRPEREQAMTMVT